MQAITSAWNWLSGKKTYLISLAAIVYAGGIQQGWWGHNVLIDGLLAGGATASIRHGISTSSAPAQDQPVQPQKAA